MDATGGDPSTYTVTASGDLIPATGVITGIWTYDSHDLAYGTDDHGYFDGALVP